MGNSICSLIDCLVSAVAARHVACIASNAEVLVDVAAHFIPRQLIMHHNIGKRLADNLLGRRKSHLAQIMRHAALQIVDDLFIEIEAGQEDFHGDKDSRTAARTQRRGVSPS